MKAVLIIFFSFIIALLLICKKHQPAVNIHVNGVLSLVAAPGFKKDIQPILQKNCSPCHFPGGKMYAAMPFDKPETIIGHEAGALKRFNNAKEKELVKKFIEGNKGK
jgi:hypothetical protein